MASKSFTGKRCTSYLLIMIILTFLISSACIPLATAQDDEYYGEEFVLGPFLYLDGSPILGGAVTLTEKTRTGPYTATTDDLGLATFQTVPQAGTYTLTVVKEDITFITDDITINSATDYHFASTGSSTPSTSTMDPITGEQEGEEEGEDGGGIGSMATYIIIGAIVVVIILLLIFLRMKKKEEPEEDKIDEDLEEGWIEDDETEEVDSAQLEEDMEPADDGPEWGPMIESDEEGIKEIPEKKAPEEPKRPEKKEPDIPPGKAVKDCVECGEKIYYTRPFRGVVYLFCKNCGAKETFRVDDTEKGSEDTEEESDKEEEISLEDGDD